MICDEFYCLVFLLGFSFKATLPFLFAYSSAFSATSLAHFMGGWAVGMVGVNNSWRFLESPVMKHKVLY